MRTFPNLCGGLPKLCGSVARPWRGPAYVGRMTRTHIFTLSVLLGLALAFGVFALARTTHLGASAHSRTDAQIALQNRQLDTTERALRRAIAQVSAPLPTVSPTAAPVASPVAQRTVYVRPAPHVITLHRSGGSDDGSAGAREVGQDD